MKRVLISVTVAIALLCSVLPAQETKSITRLEKQHGPSRFQSRQLKQTEEGLLSTISGSLEGGQQMAIQTLRDLEQLFPAYPFAASIKPLETVLKNEASDPISRRLAVLALDELHSDAADSIIRDVAGACDDKGLQTLCNALLVKSNNRANLGAKD
jgi:hypothetical protein